MKIMISVLVTLLSISALAAQTRKPSSIEAYNQSKRACEKQLNQVKLELMKANSTMVKSFFNENSKSNTELNQFFARIQERGAVINSSLDEMCELQASADKYYSENVSQ